MNGLLLGKTLYTHNSKPVLESRLEVLDNTKDILLNIVTL